MESRNRIGTTSLFVAIGGLIMMQIVISSGYWDDAIAMIFLAAFEAGTVGGLADRFAVNALFKETRIPIIKKPIPLITRHTNIIVKSRKQMTEGIVDLVTTKWLSKEVIRQKLEGISMSGMLIQILRNPDSVDKMLVILKDYAVTFIKDADPKKIADVIEKFLKEQLKDVNFSNMIGTKLSETISKNEHEKIWDMLLNTMERSINDAETRALLTNKINQLLHEYKNKDLPKKIFVNLAQFFGSFEPEEIAEEVIQKTATFILEAKGNPDHELREKINNALTELANTLTVENSENAVFVNSFIKKLIENSDAGPMIASAVSKVSDSVVADLNDENSRILSLIRDVIINQAEQLEQNAEARQKIDLWLKNTIVEILEKYHPEIGNMIRTSLQNLKDSELVEQIEGKVWNDLQFIRLNGAIYGAAVGATIQSIRILSEKLSG